MKKEVLIAEFLGTFLLVFFGCGAVVVDTLFGGDLVHVGICIVFGLVVMAVIYSFGNVSGAHINPAVTIALCFAGRFELRLMPGYISMQLMGATSAALLLRWIFSETEILGLTLPNINLFEAFFVEIVISFALMSVVLNVGGDQQEKKIMAGAVVGGVVTLAALVAGPVTGASMNPARSMGPAIAALNFESIWLYMVAPVIGMLLACPVYRWIQGQESSPSKGSSHET